MKRFCLALLAGFAFTSAAFAEDDWYPSRYGAEDTKGAMNNLSPEATVKAAKLVKTGKVYALGVVTGPDTPSWPGRSFGNGFANQRRWRRADWCRQSNRA
jgi:hypothetical protein